MKKQTKLVAVLSTASLLAIGASMTSFAATGWVEENGTWVYYDRNEERVTDQWARSGNGWYYLDENGELLDPGAWATEAGFVTSGAYVLESWTHDESMVYVKNPNYWNAQSVTMERLEFMLSADDATIYAAYRAGDGKKALELQLKYLELINALFIEVNPIPVKEAMNMLGMEAGPCRLPLCEMEDKNREALQKALRVLEEA